MMRLAGWVTAAFLVMLALSPARAPAHCDGMDGPVVTAAREALNTGNVDLVLIWVQKADEAEITRAFDHTLAVRKLGQRAKELADMYFFETVVRVHRAGEGAPYGGLAPAGRDLGPVIPAADQAVADGAIDPLMSLLSGTMNAGVRGRFAAVTARKSFDPGDVEAGRRYIEAYVTFMHYVEGVYEAAVTPAHSHSAEREQHEHPADPNR
jgi:hypothetical protein